VTSWNGAATHLIRLLDDPEIERLDTGKFTSVGIGGSATTPELLRAVEQRFPHLADSLGSGYGSTETGGLVSYANRAMLRETENCVGPPLPTVQVKIVDEAGQTLPEAQNGRICVRSPLVMLGYLNDPDANADSMLPGRWVDSGDLGRLRDGRLYLESRMRDLIIRGGENIACGEIENVLYEHPSVNEAAVHGAPDDRLGEIVCATIYLKKGCSATEEEIQNHVRSRLAVFKAPSHVLFVDEPLPRIASGKFDKRRLQQRAIEWLEASQSAAR